MSDNRKMNKEMTKLLLHQLEKILKEIILKLMHDVHCLWDLIITCRKTLTIALNPEQLQQWNQWNLFVYKGWRTIHDAKANEGFYNQVILEINRFISRLTEAFESFKNLSNGIVQGVAELHKHFIRQKNDSKYIVCYTTKTII